MDTRVKDGGRLEDARIVLSKAYKENITLREYCPHTLLINEVFKFRDKITNEENYPKDYLLYVIATQFVMNHFAERGMFGDEGRENIIFNQEFYKDFKLLEGRVLHIKEPGKDRDLMMSSSFINWFLTPMSKILMRYLANHPSHKEGLIGSTQDWAFNMRLSGDKLESDWIYTNKEKWFIYTDWTEATDYCEKYMGDSLLAALIAYSGFPLGYGKVSRALVCEPQPVEEEYYHSFDFEGEIFREKRIEQSIVKNGFMMGNPLTKVVLHLFHMCAEKLTRQIMKRNNFIEVRGATGYRNYNYQFRER